MQEMFRTHQERMEAIMKETKANQGKADADRKAWPEEMASMRERMDASQKEMVPEIETKKT
jgi:hypothetical protein